jgi:hypothetical protein
MCEKVKTTISPGRSVIDRLTGLYSFTRSDFARDFAQVSKSHAAAVSGRFIPGTG